MASSSTALHPSVREHLAPRMSATALAEYLILAPDGQDNILHDCRFSRPPIVAANAAALRGLRAYNCDPYRAKSALDRVKERLTEKIDDPDTKPKAKDEALRCIEAISLFQIRENALGMKAMPLREAPNFDPLEINGVLVSINPHFLVDGNGNRIGAGLIRVAKAPDPADCKTDETRHRRMDHRREMARYMVAMFQLLLERNRAELGTPDSTLSFVADLRLGERIGPAADHSVRIRAIRAACGQISRLWDGIKPKRSVLKKDEP